eukprot:6365944-Amphidinium_carterae.1
MRPLVQAMFPPDEPEIYEYIKSISLCGAPHSRGARSLQTLSFLRPLVGWPEEAVSITPRLKGASARKQVETKKRDPFIVDAVRFMEGFVVDVNNHDVERLLAGYFLMLVHCRARYSDALQVASEPTLDVVASGFGYIGAVTMTAKTSKARTFGGRGVPLVGLALGVSGDEWAKAWLSLRKTHGLQVEKEGTLNPMVDEFGGWS